MPDPAAMCRQSLVAPPAPARVSSLLAPCETSAVVAKNVTPPGAARSKPQTPRAERRSHSAVRGDYHSCALHFAHEAMGWLKARRSARPWNFQGHMRRMDYGRARAVTTTGPAKLCLLPSLPPVFSLPPQRRQVYAACVNLVACGGGGWPPERSDGGRMGGNLINVLDPAIKKSPPPRSPSRVALSRSTLPAIRFAQGGGKAGLATTDQMRRAARPRSPHSFIRRTQTAPRCPAPPSRPRSRPARDESGTRAGRR